MNQLSIQASTWNQYSSKLLGFVTILSHHTSCTSNAQRIWHCAKCPTWKPIRVWHFQFYAQHVCIVYNVHIGKMLWNHQRMTPSTSVVRVPAQCRIHIIQTRLTSNTTTAVLTASRADFFSRSSSMAWNQSNTEKNSAHLQQMIGYRGEHLTLFCSSIILFNICLITTLACTKTRAEMSGGIRVCRNHLIPLSDIVSQIW